MTDDRRYVRVYYSIVDDPRFAEIYDHDARLATWLRLLMIADALYPAPAPLPRWVRRSVLAVLCRVGLIESLPGQRFAIHGLVAERSWRSERARTSAVARWSDRNATAMRPQSDGTATASRGAHASAMLAEQEHKKRVTSPIGAVTGRARSNAVASPSGTAAPADPLTVVEAWMAAHRCAIDSNGKPATELARLVDRHGAEAVIAAMTSLGDGLTDGRQYVYGAVKALAPIPDVRPVRGYERSVEEVERAIVR